MAYFTVNMQFAYAPGNQLGVLRAVVNNQGAVLIGLFVDHDRRGQGAGPYAAVQSFTR